jgi:glycolate oxidase FAD binding subunit
MEQVLQEYRERISAAHATRAPLRLRGSGSKDWYGQASTGEVLNTRAYRGIVDYEPSELVVTARCGTPLAELEQVLAKQNQMLAFEPPHFGPGATVGGMVASGLSGPRRQGAGALRDFVLGADLVDGRGELLHFGGKVMKNVAGYDVSRLLAGSLGTLGLVASVSLKVLPRPVRETTLLFELDQGQALHNLNAWSGRALPISGSSWLDGRLALRLSGAGAAVDAAARQLGGEVMADAGRFWDDLREQRTDFFAGAHSAGLWRLALPATTPPLPLPGRQLIEWGGGQRWLLGDSGADIDAATIRRAAHDAGGHATLFRGGDKRQGVFSPLQPALARIHRRLKETFDPAGIFNPARMYNEF